MNDNELGLDKSSLLNAIVDRMDSRTLSRLWSFYRNYFQTDDQCLLFFYNGIKNEPLSTEQLYINEMGLSPIDRSNCCPRLDNRVFIPRRMMNTVEQLVITAQEVSMVHNGKDIIKLILLVTCIETLQILKEPCPSKWDMLFSFFWNYTSEEDKSYIIDRFCVEYYSDSLNDFENSEAIEPYLGFINAIYEYRNTALHEGKFDEICFNNWPDRDECPKLSCLSMNLKGERNQVTNKKTRTAKKDYIIHSRLSYSDFESIVVRTSISFIEGYVKEIQA